MKNETKNEMNETEQQLKLKEVAATEYMHQYLIEAQENNVLRAQARHSMRLGTIELDIIPTDKSQSLEDVMKQFSAFAKLMQMPRYRLVNFDELGKCTLCARQVVNDSTKFWCKETRLINMKLYCGGCLLDLGEIVNDVLYAFSVKHDQVNNNEQRFYSIDEATGRMVVDG